MQRLVTRALSRARPSMRPAVGAPVARSYHDKVIDHYENPR